MLKPYDSKVRRFRDWDVEIHLGEYANERRPALVLLAADTARNWSQNVAPGEPIATASVNLPNQHLNEGETFIKSWSENVGMLSWLQDEGIASFTGRCAPAGHCLADVVTIVRTSE